MSVNACDHRTPLFGLIRKTRKVGLILIILIPIGEFCHLFKRSMWNLSGKQTKEGLAGLIVFHCLFPYKIQTGEGIDIITISNLGIVRMILRSWIVRIVLIIAILCHTIGLKFQTASYSRFSGCIPQCGLKKGMGPHMMQFGHHKLIAMRGG